MVGALRRQAGATTLSYTIACRLVASVGVGFAGCTFAQPVAGETLLAPNPAEEVSADKRLPTLHDVGALARVGGVAVDPNGDRLAVEADGRVRIIDLSTNRVVSEFSGSDVSWSPDGNQLAYWSGAGTARQIHVWSVVENRTRQLTSREEGFAQEPLRGAQPLAWHPDGGRIAFSATPDTAVLGRSEEAPLVRIYDRDSRYLDVFDGVFRAGNGYFVDQSLAVSRFLRDNGTLDALRSKGFIVHTETGEVRRISPDGSRQFIQGWSLDGSTLLTIDDTSLSRSPLGPERTDLVLFDGETGREFRRLEMDTIVVQALWAPDGEHIAATVRERPIDFQTLRLWERRSDTWRSIQTPGDRSVVDWTWTSQTVLVIRLADAFSDSLWRYDVKSGHFHRHVATPETGALGPFDTNQSGDTITVRSSGNRSGVVKLHSGTGRSAEVFDANPQLTELRLGAQQRLTWQNSRGDDVNGVLLLPPDYQEGQRLPVLVDMYPTPARDGLHLSLQALGQLQASGGYAVFYPGTRSPHGLNSFSQSESYTEGAHGVAGIDLMRDDLESGLRQLENIGVAEPGDVCLFGFSNGGYAVNLLLVQDIDIACAVVWSGHSNLVFNRHWYEPDTWSQLLIGDGDVGDNPDAYLALSPVFQAHDVDAPLLMIVGDQDWYSWLPEMIMQFNALRDEGKPAILLRYTNEGHQFSSPEAIHDVQHRLLAFFDRHLKMK